MQINPTELAKKAGIWPKFKDDDGVFIPIDVQVEGPETEGKAINKRIEGRDAAYERIKILREKYEEWANGPGGIIDDPGPKPEPVKKPMEIESAGPEDAEKFRKATDDWFDSTYLTEYLPSTELWAVANDLWTEKQADERAEVLEHKAKSPWKSIGQITAVAAASLAIPMGVGYPLAAYDVLPVWACMLISGVGSMVGLFLASAVFSRRSHN